MAPQFGAEPNFLPTWRKCRNAASNWLSRVVDERMASPKRRWRGSDSQVNSLSFRYQVQQGFKGDYDGSEGAFQSRVRTLRFKTTIKSVITQ